MHQNRQAILNQFAANAPVGMNMRSGMQQQITPQVSRNQTFLVLTWVLLECCLKASFAWHWRAPLLQWVGLSVMLFLIRYLKPEVLSVFHSVFVTVSWYWMVKYKALHPGQLKQQHFLGLFTVRSLFINLESWNFTLRNNWIEAREMAQKWRQDS